MRFYVYAGAGHLSAIFAFSFSVIDAGFISRFVLWYKDVLMIYVEKVSTFHWNALLSSCFVQRLDSVSWIVIKKKDSH